MAYSFVTFSHPHILLQTTSVTKRKYAFWNSKFCQCMGHKTEVIEREKLDEEKEKHTDERLKKETHRDQDRVPIEEDL